MLLKRAELECFVGNIKRLVRMLASAEVYDERHRRVKSRLHLRHRHNTNPFETRKVRFLHTQLRKSTRNCTILWVCKTAYRTGVISRGTRGNAVLIVVKLLEHTSLKCLRTHLRLRNDLYCVGWGVKLYSLTHLRTHYGRHCKPFPVQNALNFDFAYRI